MNVPYRHLEDKLRIWNLTIAQWALALLVAGVSEFNAWLYIRSAWRWWRTPGRYRPGPGPRPTGYVIAPPARPAHERGSTVKPIDVEALWES
jgi:hypothetical protein